MASETSLDGSTCDEPQNTQEVFEATIMNVKTISSEEVRESCMDIFRACTSDFGFLLQEIKQSKGSSAKLVPVLFRIMAKLEAIKGMSGMTKKEVLLQTLRVLITTSETSADARAELEADLLNISNMVDSLAMLAANGKPLLKAGKKFVRNLCICQ